MKRTLSSPTSTKAMLGKMIYRIHLMCRSLKRTLLITLVSLGLFSIYWIDGHLEIKSNISDLIPKGEQFKQLDKLFSEADQNKKIIFAIDLKNNPGEPPIILERIAKTAKELGIPIKLLQNPPTNPEQMNQFMLDNLPLFMDSTDYNTLDSLLSEDSMNKKITSTLQQLQNPEGTVLMRFFKKDPLFLSHIGYDKIAFLSKQNNWVARDGFLLSQTEDTLFINAEISLELFDNKEKVTLKTQMDQLIVQLQLKDLSADYFGVFLIAAENAIQAKKDSILTLSIALIAIFLLLLLYYRNAETLLLFFIPGLFGGVFALLSITLFKGGISMMALASGAIVLGIVVDYSFHFFTHYNHCKSIQTTLNEVGLPLITGNVTTIIAFLSLMFTNSKILQDFGLFAGLTLFFSIVVLLFFVPLLLKENNLVNVSAILNEKTALKRVKTAWGIPKAITFIVICIITLLLIPKAKEIKFNNDPAQLGFHPEILKEKEKKYFNTHPNDDQIVFLFNQNKNANQRNLDNLVLGRHLNALLKEKKIELFTSFGPINFTPQHRQESIEKWNTYWQLKGENFIKTLSQQLTINGINPVVCDHYKTYFSGNYQISDTLLPPVFNELKNQLYFKSNSTSPYFLSTVKIKKNNNGKPLKELSSIPGTEVFNKTQTAASFMELIKDDFNYILLVSSLLVFFTLLIIYGRIELALIVFLPMVVSWIWIMGIANLLNIQLNMVNLVIATFIFGLGDDFAIFISDGMQNQFVYGKRLMRSYKKAIFLSALSTIIGTGVLIFAEHPALKSIALISVLGLLCILLISFVLQPILFDFMIGSRTKKGQSPWTLMNLLLSVIAFGFFVFGCFFSIGINAALYILPIKKKYKRLTMNHLLRFFTGSLIYLMANVKKRFFDAKNFDFKNPSIIVVNHSSFLDILLMVMMHPKIVILTNDWVYNSPFFGINIRRSGYIRASDGMDKNLELISQRIQQGYSVVIFPEGTRSKDGNIGRFHKGAFYLAEQLKVDITPVLIHGAHYTMAKSDFQLRDSYLNVKVLPRIAYNDPEFGNGYRNRTKNIGNYFRMAYQNFKSERENQVFFRPRMLYNYLYRGPVLEWYLKIKYQMEGKNYAFYNEQLKGKTQITDLGCGYGFLSYYLLFNDPNKRINAYDYDQDKISIARHCFEKNDRINFSQIDIREADITPSDGIFLMDVLHYFNHNDQYKLLEKCVCALNPGGKLMIRDGIIENKRHIKTQWTEKISTTIGFNKKIEALVFLSKIELEQFAFKNELKMNFIEHSQKTSNALIIMEKENG